MKKALNESTIRKFMKLANIEGLSENFVEKNVNEEDMGAEFGEEDEDAMGEAPLETDEMADGPPEADAMGEVSPETVEAIVDAIADALESVTGVEINVDSTGGGEEVDMGAEEEMPEEEFVDTAEDAVEMSSDEEELEEGWDEIEEALEEADVSLDENPNKEDFLNEVTKRVAKRLLNLSKKA